MSNSPKVLIPTFRNLPSLILPNSDLNSIYIKSLSTGLARH
jgi:hypothetical protein